MTLQEATKLSTVQLETIYEKGEAASIAEWLIEHLSGIRKKYRGLQREVALNTDQQLQLTNFLQALLTHEPIQYVIHEAWFCGLLFYVDSNVLIPRPETEELVEWIIANCKFPVDQLSILDIGTGSGCIPITLKRRLRKAVVHACDISDAALAVARRNADTLGADIELSRIDFLDDQQSSNLPSVDIIVSNPPYIPEKDKATMQPNVLKFEPFGALFVPDQDALVFYKAIASFARERLNSNGEIYLEIHEDFGEAITKLFQSQGYATEVKKDMQGKDRMVKAWKRISS